MTNTKPALAGSPRWLLRGITATALMLLMAGIAFADTITLDTSFPGRGWFQANGQHVATNDNTFTGFGHASFYIWDVTSLAGKVVTSVQLRIGEAALNTQPPLIQINDVSTSSANLIAGYALNSAAGQAIYQDLTTGAVYGSFATSGPTVAPNTLAFVSFIYDVPLSAQAVADLNAAISTGHFAIGLSALTNGGAIFDQTPPIQQLIVTTSPVPEPSSLLLLGSGIAGLWLKRRRAAAN